MNHCPETIKVQDWLDGELSPAEAARFEAHPTTCGQCEAEALAFRVVFTELRAVPLLVPRPELFDRIMDEVLPHRTPRWVKVLGWGYAASFPASLAAIGSAFVLPGPGVWGRGIIEFSGREWNQQQFRDLSGLHGKSRRENPCPGCGNGFRVSL